ncbi:acyltransferase family protein [Paraferrimonas sedimenticola]|uniref:Polysaccharide biosynthesis protein n=1 Tax=Paraferrimonas sedimenticola TaxID=375674 RepID=A0AA37RWJ6_9GAMM|nr:acyltransferase [Paraferrimonas sedimenticola]GLP96032.1 polysaccharide biosynthesis protein [Paraferrimonas sedimenticola]
MSDELSQRIAVTRLLMILGLVLLHFGAFPGTDINPFRGVQSTDGWQMQALNSSVLYWFFGAVPLLSIVSGYLFFYQQPRQFQRKLKNRLTNLVLPSLVWIGLWQILINTGYTVNLIDDGGGYLARAQGELHITLAGALWSLFDGPAQHVAQQFWFIHDLIYTLLLSPLLYWCIKRVPKLFLVALGAAWLTGIDVPIFYRLDVLLFFSLGTALALHKGGQQKLAWFVSKPVFILAVLVTWLLILARVFYPLLIDKAIPFEHQWECIIRMGAVIAFCGLVVRLHLCSAKLHGVLVHFSGLSFFIFASHYPLLELVKRSWHKLFYVNSSIEQLAVYLLTPVITLGLIYGFAWLLHSITPGLFRFLNGQRAFPMPVMRFGLNPAR